MMSIEKNDNENENQMCLQHNKIKQYYCKSCMDTFCVECDQLVHSTNSSVALHIRVNTEEINSNILHQLGKDLIVGETINTLKENRNAITSSGNNKLKLSTGSSNSTNSNSPIIERKDQSSIQKLPSEYEYDDSDTFQAKNSPLIARKSITNNNSATNNNNNNNSNNSKTIVNEDNENDKQDKKNMVTFTNEYEFRSNSCALEDGEVDDFNEEEEKKNREAEHVGKGIVDGVKLGINGFLTGAKGIVLEPKEGIKKEGAKGFFKGVGVGLGGAVINPIKGTAGFLTKTSEGLRNTPNAIFSDKNDPNNLDTFHQREKEADNILEGIFQGTLSLSKNIFDGVTGVVMDPINGAQQQGAKGFFKGLGSGLMGVVVKPVSGAIDFVGKPIEGLTSQVSSNLQTLKNL
ncbi:hypothetical protein DLAC_08349 [Tieghemostelium lacteum]|uniref:B box-type domain-containing protein n=1 Tax=Tieghemostelium lacteum TaxID=361077 RepID=A0A151ZBR8_TIELA|nr:hypothetical protein DLAC_08349 [Tieghemostelium lacteum]|eukprot:KYQ91390.1 hypothetical protein DLAC_08349 [Tieghemostelium lacteum]